MLAIAKRLGIATFCVVVAVCVVLPGEIPLQARGPYGATYCSQANEVFWFVHASDLHIGTSGSTDSSNLSWLVTTARTVINPSFIVVTGDLTDSTNGNIFGYPNGPYQAEWDQYKAVLSAAGIKRDNPQNYYDLPGNHDAYNDQYFAFYRANAIRGGEYQPGGQVTWSVSPGFGEYRFVGVNTADNTGDSFSILSPYGDHAGLDSGELTALNGFLGGGTANLTFAFGHHPVSSTGDSSDTYLYYGATQFVSALNGNGVVGYGYGHVHDNVDTFFTGNSYTGYVTPGFRYTRVPSLGKDSPNGYRIVSVDCDGVNSVFQPYNTWPAVLITAPVDRYAGGVANPFAYTVPPLATNPIRALVFAATPPTSVTFSVDGGPGVSMTRVASSPQWAGTWDASGLLPGTTHTITVTAGTRSHTISVAVAGENQAPVALDDSYTTPNNTVLRVAAPGVMSNDHDPDGNPITARLLSQGAKGSVVLDGNGAFTYTPSGAPTGTDTFTYEVSDGTLASTASVTITLTSPPPATDTVTINSAVYTRKTSMLAVKATSSMGGTGTTLTITTPVFTDGGVMTYSAKTKAYTYSVKLASAPASVTVTSSKGGSATKGVSVK